MPKRRKDEEIEATVGSGNVFADLGFENPEQEFMKARLSLEIFRLIRERGLTQMQAAEILGIKQPQVSLLMRNRAGSFSVGKLMELLTTLGQDIQIVVKPAKREHGELSVLVG
jgi:predicted XRE-type DNA-binding protein